MSQPVTVRSSVITARGEATRARIVEAAAELIAVHGVSGTSLDDVRRASSTSKSQLYHYFTDKADLVRAVISHQLDAVLRDQRLVDEPLDSVAAVHRWRYRTVALQRAAGFERGCRLGRMSAELSAADERTRSALAEAFSTWHSALAAGLATMVERGDLPPHADPVVLAWGLLGALQGGALLAMAAGDARPLQDALDHAAERILTLADSAGRGAASATPEP